jgi:cob(I)alamin adenosyltransferase
MAKILGKLRRQEPMIESIGSVDELQSQIDTARDSGKIGWDFMPL